MKSFVHTIIVLTVCGVFSATTACSSQGDPRADLLEAKISVQNAASNGTEKTLMNARGYAADMCEQYPKSKYAHYYLAYANYCLVNRIDRSKKDEALAYLDEAIEHLERSVDIDDAFSEAYALLASCYSSKIGFDWQLGQTVGPKSDAALKRAIELDPDNPRIVMIKAIGDFFTPPQYGGSPVLAMQGYKRAAQLFKTWSSADELAPDWGAAEVHAWIGMAHMNARRFDDAEAAFQQALAVEPQFGWVQYVLMPQLENSRKESK